MAFQPRGNGAQQFCQWHGFYQVIVGAQVHAGADVAAFAFGRKKNKRNSGGLRIVSQRHQHAMAIQFGHRHIAENQGRQFSPGGLDPLLSIRGGQRLIVLHFQYVGEIGPHIGLVFDD